MKKHNLSHKNAVPSICSTQSVNGNAKSKIRTSRQNISDSQRLNLIEPNTVETPGSVHKMNAENDYQYPYHSKSVGEVLQHYQTRITGLTRKERRKRLLRDGPNVVSSEKLGSALSAFIRSQFDMFGSLLWIAALGCFLIYYISEYNHIEGQEYNFLLGWVLIGVNIFSGVLNYIQTTSQQRTLKSFQNIVPGECLALIEGQTRKINPDKLVKGDIVLLKAGFKVPADVRIIDVCQLQIDMSAFTGESEPQTRSIDNQQEEILNATNMAFFTCPITNGEGVGVVVETGIATQIGQQQRAIRNIPEIKTPLQREMDRFINFVFITSIVIGITFFGITLLLNIDILESAILAVTIIISCVPESIPLSFTVSQTLAVKNLAAKKVVVKRLADVETLGVVSVICTDKTGTITLNKMVVNSIYDNTTINQVKWDSSAKTAKVTVNKTLLNVLRLNNAAEPISNKIKCALTSNASEQGIWRFIDALEGHRNANSHQVLFNVPFSSTLKYQLKIHKYCDDKNIITIKGAPEMLLDKCTFVDINGSPVPKTDQHIENYQQAVETAARQGCRVIALVYSFTNKTMLTPHETENLLVEDLVLAGFITLVDPPKPHTKLAITHCKLASVQVTMVTGDHYLTAVAIAQKVGIIGSKIDYYLNSSNTFQQNPQEGCVITGDYMRQSTVQQLIELLHTYQSVVCARITPEQKLQIVKMYQSLNKVVAVTGDGLNDASALRQADIGVAMASGSECAKEASKVIDVENSFGKIVDGIVEGRLIFDNLKKAMAYTLSMTTAELLPFVLFILTGFPVMLSETVYILIDIATSIWPAYAIAYEPAESNLMHRGPRSRKDKLFDMRMLLYCYIRAGLYQTACEIFMFVYVVRRETFKITNKALEFSQFISFQHEDFLKSTLHSFFSNYQLSESVETVARTIYWKGQSGAFLAIVLTQLAHALTSRTRMNSMITQGLFTNKAIYLGIALMLAFTLAFLYIPQLHEILQTQCLDFHYWLVTSLFAVVFIAADELRKLVIRRVGVNSCIGRWFYW